MTFSPLYYQFIHSRAWLWIRKRALHRAGYKCERCRSHEHLHVHHKTYARFGGNELPEDLMVLCVDCHTVQHGRERDPADPRRTPRPVSMILADLAGLPATIEARHDTESAA